MLRKACILLAILCAFAHLSSPWSLREDIKISLKEKRIMDFSISGLSIVFYVNISNFSSSPYYLTDYDYRFVVNQKEYFRLQKSLERKIIIEEKEDKLLSFPVKITYAHLFKAAEGIEKENMAQGHWSGSMTFSDGRKKKGRIRFAFFGEFPIFIKPEIEFLSLKVKEVTIGGADLSFEMGFKNSNAFELMIDRIGYRFHLGGKLIGEGIINEKRNIESQGREVFSFPLLMNFFEVGKEVYSILHQSSSLCRFSGEIEVRTKWGRAKIPFDKSEKVTISRTP